MSTKLNSDCLHNAADDEPIFVFRAQDKTAPGFIRAWAAQNHALGMSQSKVGKALQVADEMEAWHTRKMPT